RASSRDSNKDPDTFLFAFGNEAKRLYMREVGFPSPTPPVSTVIPPVISPSARGPSGSAGARLVPQPLRDVALALVGAVAVRARHVEQHRQVLEPLLAEEHPQAILAELALTEVRVAVAVRPERGHRVVEVKRLQALEFDVAVEFVEDVGERIRLAHLIPRRVQ